MTSYEVATLVVAILSLIVKVIALFNRRKK